MTIRRAPEDRDMVKSLEENLADKKSAMDKAIQAYCEAKASLIAQDRQANGQPLPQELISKITIRSIILTILRNNPKGSALHGIVLKLKQYGRQPNAETVSSTLNRLKRDGIIEKSKIDPKFWCLSEFGNGHRR